MEFSVLGSGSSGNCVVAAGSSCCLLVDLGLSAKQIELRLSKVGVRTEDLSGILLTHEHNDHTAGLRVFLRKHRIPVYCNSGTARALRFTERLPGADLRLFETGTEFSIEEIKVQSFSVPHDADDPVGFRLEEQESSIAVLTDLGYVTNLVTNQVRGVNGLVLEANYDEALLQQDTKRPWSVKQRIASRHGHLSNVAAAAAAAELMTERLEHVVLCHLSRDCNTPRLAMDALNSRLPSSTSLHASRQDEPTCKLRVG